MLHLIKFQPIIQSKEAWKGVSSYIYIYIYIYIQHYHYGWKHGQKNLRWEGKSCFQGLHMTCVIFVLVYNLKICISSTF